MQVILKHGTVNIKRKENITKSTILFNRSIFFYFTIKKASYTNVSLKNMVAKSNIRATEKVDKSKSHLDFIEIRGACENNLKNVNIDIPKNKFVVITGPSGSGKSSLAFNTIYAEGHRRYVEGFSGYASYFLGKLNKPQVESIKGLTPAIAIDQKTTSRNPRSTVGTITETYDLLRLIFARIGKVFSPKTNQQLTRYSKQEIISLISLLPLDTKLRLLTTVIKAKTGNFISELTHLKKQGYEKVRIDGKFVNINEKIPDLKTEEQHTIDIVIDRIIMKQNMGSRIHDAVEKCLKVSGNTVILNVVELPDGKTEITLHDDVIIKVNEFKTLSLQYVCPESGFVLEELEPKIFSFNTPFGACPECNGLGTEVFFKEDLIVPDENLPLLEGAIEPWNFDSRRYHNQILASLAKKYNFSVNTPYKELPNDVKKIIMYGTGDEEIKIEFEENMRKMSNMIRFQGVIGELKSKIQNANEDPIILAECEKYQTLTKCHYCNGCRLRKEVLQVKVAGINIGELCDRSVEQLKEWLQNLYKNIDKNEFKIVEQAVNEVIARLDYLLDVGLGYLTIMRSANTLSGGEAQRVRLATQIGNGLCGLTYVLDEPSIGLHQADNDKLIYTLKKLRDAGNNVIVIEHDEDTIKNADYLIDIGPGAGKYGGEVIDQGTPDEVAERKKGMTGMFLSGAMKIPAPKARRKFGNGEFIEITGCCENNLKNVDLKIPLGKFIAVSGVSGGGKSTLILDTLYTALAQQMNRAKTRPGKYKDLKGIENIDKVIRIEQDPIGRTPRSSAATYTGLFTMIRDLFTALPESLARGYKSGRFSFNVKGGRCENCQGDGMVKVEMQLLPDVYIKCPVCNGKRYNKETLEIKLKGYSINEILEMSVREALEFFKDEVAISEKLKTLYNVGLDYLKLGQPATTLSGGEAQRIRLAKELSRKATGNTLYILDEPTTGLHSCDIKQLLHVLHTLVDYGNTVVVIEHNIDVIKTADYVIDMGPSGGDKGGYIVAQGTPEEICNNIESVTGKYLFKKIS